MKKTINIIIISLFIFILSTIVMSLIIINSGKVLTSFNIISVENINTLYNIKFEKVKAATSYEIVIYNQNNEIFYNEVVNDNNISLNLDKIKYNQKYKLVIFAYDKVNDSISVNNPYTFTYSEPTFSKNNSLVLINNQDYNLQIDGDLTKKKYLITINDGNYVIKKEELKDNDYIIPSDLFTNSNQAIDVKIYDGINLVNKITLYNNVSPVSDINILSPVNDNSLEYNDVVVNFEGGENATKYIVEIYKKDLLLKETTVSKKRFIVSSNFFNKSEEYKIKLKAVYEDFDDFTKTSEVTFKMNEKDTLKPAYINLNHKYVKKGSSIVISNPNNGGKIYYTIDGSDPKEKGILYEKPIVIENNIVLKTVVKEEKKNDSIIGEYNINIQDKKEYRVYLSPSNQDGNIGVNSVGYTNEAKEMNDVADFIENKLKEYGVKVYRNNPNGNINLWTSDSRFYNADVHLAIHSNASTTHEVSGVETWVNEQSSLAYDLGNIIQKDLMNIYYNKDKDRGVKYANGSLGEVRLVPLGILVEVAHHDFLEDASWIMTNKKLIGETLANSILKYFGII